MFYVCAWNRTLSTSGFFVWLGFFFRLKLNQTPSMLWSAKLYLLLSMLIFGFIYFFPPNPASLFSFIFFLFFFLPNNFLVEWTRLGERPGDEKMGPVRNPGQWGDLPEPPGGTAAGKRWGQIPFQHWYSNFHCCFHPEFPRTSQTVSYKLPSAKDTCHSSGRERGLEDGLDMAQPKHCYCG